MSKPYPQRTVHRPNWDPRLNQTALANPSKTVDCRDSSPAKPTSDVLAVQRKQPAAPDPSRLHAGWSDCTALRIAFSGSWLPVRKAEYAGTATSRPVAHVADSGFR